MIPMNRCAPCAIVALTRIDAESPSIAEAVAECLSDPSASGRTTAALVLTRFGPAAHAAVPALADAMNELRNYDLVEPYPYSVRQQAARRWWRLAPARAAIPTLIDALRDGEAGTRAAAAFALGQIAPPDSSIVAELRLAAADEDDTVRIRAAGAISALESAARQTRRRAINSGCRW